MAREFRPTRSTSVGATEDGPVRDLIVEHTTELVNQIVAKQVAKQVAKHAEKVVVKASKHVDSLDRLAEHLDTIEVWTRHGGKGRKPRLSRADIAAAAIRIADSEGFEALSMRRLAAELDVGTMSLYHYVRTKEELLTLVLDAMMAEVLIPSGTAMPKSWRAAITLVAQRSRDALLRHPWILDISDDPPIGPNAMRHFDQTLQAIERFDAPLEIKLELMLAVDEYVFGYCVHWRNNLQRAEMHDGSVMSYMQGLFDSGDYPTLSGLVAEHGFAPLWERINTQMRDVRRFERNLSRLLDGFETGSPSGSRALRRSVSD